MTHSYLEKLTRCALSASSEAQLLAELASSVEIITGCDAVDLFQSEGQSLVLKASSSAPEYCNRVRLGKGVGLAGQVAQSLEPLFIEKAAETEVNYAKFPGIDDPHCEACVVLPILAGELWGVMLLRKDGEWEFNSGEKDELLSVAEDLGIVIRLFENAFAAGARASRLGPLSEVSRTITSSPYIEEILQLLVNLTAQQFQYVVCTVRLLDEQHQELVLRATQAPAKAYARKRAIKIGESIAGKAINENRPVIVPDVQTEADYIGHDLAVEQGMRSMICVPLTIQGRPIGVMSCYTDEVREFLPDEVRALETLAKQAAVSIEHAKLQVRSTLMQEMHHRVKNNLQQVASLLRLQTRQKQDKSLEEVISDCLARILAISSVHDLLSREDLDHVGIRSIAEMLVRHQISSLILPDRTIRFDVRGDDVRLNMNQATQVALVMNELIQNAVEHGFEITTEGDVHITVETDDETVSLWVSNNGDVLPPGFDMHTSSHLGMQIVESLARGLGGRFTIEEKLGWTVAEVSFAKGGM